MRLKDDETAFLQALRLGTAGTARLSPARRTALQGQFERKGWMKDGKLTRLGEHLAEKNPPREQSEPVPQAVKVERQPEDSKERQTDGTVEPEIQRQQGGGVESDS